MKQKGHVDPVRAMVADAARRTLDDDPAPTHELIALREEMRALLMRDTLGLENVETITVCLKQIEQAIAKSKH